jgi:Tannase and feruloyl esterase
MPGSIPLRESTIESPRTHPINSDRPNSPYINLSSLSPMRGRIAVHTFGSMSPYSSSTTVFTSRPRSRSGSCAVINWRAATAKHRWCERMYWGWGDPALNPRMGVSYYEQVSARMGPATSDFFRLFLVPGMLHCGGGVGPSEFDAMTTMIRWVELGAAPDHIVGTHSENGKPSRTRPLCPYPEVARYKGMGSNDDAGSFTCHMP